MATSVEAAPVVVALVRDLFFAVRIQDAIRAAGGQPQILEDPAGLWDAIDAFPALAIIDLNIGDGWAETVRRAKNLPHTRSVPIIAYGSHVDTEALKRARDAGCDHAWARSRFVQELPALLQRTFSPSPRVFDGCDEPPDPRLLHGIEQFNHGEYWECHETLEGLWMAEERPIRVLYQGILQVGVAFHHLRQRNYAGAIKTFRRALPRFEGCPERCHGVAVGSLARAARAIHDEVVRLGPERIGEYDLSNLPRIDAGAS